MSGVVKTTPPMGANVPADPTAGDVLSLFPIAQIEKMIVEGFALALERRMQGTSMDNLLETLQFAADFRLFKEGLALTREQVCRMLQISDRTFERIKDQFETDPSIGKGSPRYNFFSILEKRRKRLLEAHPDDAPKATIKPLKKGKGE